MGAAADDERTGEGDRRSAATIAEHSIRARERARMAMERATMAEGRARDRLGRAGERAALLRQIAGALVAATAAPAVLDLVTERGVDPASVRVTLAEVDPETGIIRLELRPDGIDAVDAGPPSDAVSPLARATLHAAEQARLSGVERQLRDTLEAVVHQMPIGVLVAEAPSGRITLANELACTMLGGAVRDWSDTTAYGDVDLRGPSGRRLEAGDWPLARAVRSGRATQESRVEAVAPDGSRRSLLVSAVPVLDRDGSVAAAVQAMVDVTAHEEASIAREAILGVLSHELRTPVTTLLGGSELLQDRWRSLEEAERAELLAANVEEAERLVGVIDNMLVLARIDAGVASVDRHPVLLQHAAERVVARERRRFGGTTFQVEHEGKRGLPAVLGDEGAVDQVLSNLLSNAAKYGQPRGTVGVCLAHESSEVAVRVLDDGPGLSSTELPDLFRLFVRGADAPRRASGAGIGLYVSARLVDAMGGRIWAANRPEGGAEFGFALAVSPAIG